MVPAGGVQEIDELRQTLAQMAGNSELMGMRERALLYGGKLSIESALSQRAEITADLSIMWQNVSAPQVIAAVRSGGCDAKR